MTGDKKKKKAEEGTSASVKTFELILPLEYSQEPDASVGNTHKSAKFIHQSSPKASRHHVVLLRWQAVE